jgi:N-acetylglutamate synthase-like GNAT family acetyltransferase
MLFASQTETYRRQFPRARFDIIEREGTPIGRLVVAEDGASACIVDIALLPDSRGGGAGSAILGSVLALLGARVAVVWCTVL